MHPSSEKLFREVGSNLSRTNSVQHTIFALPFALLATVWASFLPALDGKHHRVGWREIAGILLCMVAARSFAMAVNRLVDAKFDAMNPRTAKRHIPAGLIGANSVLLFAIGCAVCSA